MAVRRPLVFMCALVISALACNLQSAATPTVTPATSATPPTSSPTSGAGVSVSVTSPTYCREGPTTDFDIVLTANPGASFEVVGANRSLNYWIIRNPVGGTCWLWGRYAVLTGDTSTLPEYPPPPTPIGPTKTPAPATFTPSPSPTTAPTSTTGPQVPSAPAGLAGDRYCEAFFSGSTPMWRETVSLLWIDTASGELGFRIYQKTQGQAEISLGNIPPNSGAYYPQLEYTQGTGGPIYDNFSVTAFNGIGESTRATVDVYRCP